MKNLTKWWWLAIMSLLIISCSKIPSVYRTDIFQGNYIESGRLENVKLDMTQSQVQLILGTPLIKDAFNEETWFYVFSHYQSDGSEIAHQDIRIHFKNKKVSRIEVVKDAGLTQLH